MKTCKKTYSMPKTHRKPYLRRTRYEGSTDLKYNAKEFGITRANDIFRLSRNRLGIRLVRYQLGGQAMTHIYKDPEDNACGISSCSTRSSSIHQVHQDQYLDDSTRSTSTMVPRTLDQFQEPMPLGLALVSHDIHCNLF